MSAERTVPMHCTSLRKPFGQSGRIGRSIMRAVRIARSVGRPLALEEAARDLPGGVHALLDVDGEREEVRAFARFRPPCAVARTMVSPERTTTAPSACFASLPVSNVISSADRHRDGREAFCGNRHMFLHVASWKVEV